MTKYYLNREYFQFKVKNENWNLFYFGFMNGQKITYIGNDDRRNAQLEEVYDLSQNKFLIFVKS